MSASGTSQVQDKVKTEGLSKRQQRKLEQTLKIFQSQETQQIRDPKRRAHTHIAANQQKPRKQIKIDPACRTPISEDIISSSPNSQEPGSTTPLARNGHPLPLPQHLNPAYTLPQEQAAIFNYLLCYSFAQGERQLSKETQDWTTLDALGGESLLVIDSKPSAKICSKLDAKFQEQKDKIRQPFSRNHRDFEQQFLKKQFLQE